MIKFWYKQFSNISKKAQIGDGTIIHAGCHLHDEVKIGKNCKIEAQVFIPNGVELEDEVFVGPQVCFTNDPKLNDMSQGRRPTKTLVKKGARIGANATIRAGVIIGENAIIGCGSVVLHNISANEVWAGNPAKKIK